MAAKRPSASSTPKTPAARKSGKELINYDDAIAAELAALTERTAAPSGDKVKLNRDGTIQLPDGSTGDVLECIILDFNSMNIYYDRPYKQDDIAPPACFAIGDNPRGLTPSETSPDKQCADCASCPMNQFGSALNGSGKACANRRQVAITPISSLDLEPGDTVPVYILSVPPTAIKFFDSYVREVATKYKTIPTAIVTELSQEPGSQWAAPRFAAKRTLAKEELQIVFAGRDAARDRLAAEPDVSQYEPSRVTPKGRAPARRR